MKKNPGYKKLKSRLERKYLGMKKFSTCDKNLDVLKNSRLEIKISTWKKNRHLKHLNLNKKDLDLNIETLTLQKEFLT